MTEPFDEFRCWESLTRASGTADVELRQQRVKDFLANPGYLQFIHDYYCYWRGNLYVVRGEVSDENPPIHWHWRWNRQSNDLLPQPARIALPFFQDGKPEPVPDDARLELERNLLRDQLGLSSHNHNQDALLTHKLHMTRYVGGFRKKLTSYLMIRAVQQTESSEQGIIQEIERGEILFSMGLHGAFVGGFKSEDLVLECCALADPEELLWDWMTRNQGGVFRNIFACFPTKEHLKDRIAWVTAGSIYARPCFLSDPDAPKPKFADPSENFKEPGFYYRDEFRFFLGEVGIEKVGHIVCFKAGDFVLGGEQFSAYCLLELSCPLPAEKRYSLVSLFSRIAQVGALSVALDEYDIYRFRAYMHSFDKPLRPLGYALDQVEKESDPEKRAKKCLWARGILESVHIQAQAALKRDLVTKTFSVHEAVQQTATLYDQRFQEPVIELIGSDVTVWQRRDYFRTFLNNAISNAVNYGATKLKVRVAWANGSLPGHLLSGMGISRDQDPNLQDALTREDQRLGTVNLDHVVLLVHNFRDRDAEPAMNSAKHVGEAVMKEMVEELGGQFFQRTTEESFVVGIAFPIRHPEKTAGNAHQAETHAEGGEGHA